MSYFDFRIPGLKLTVVAADGQNIEPVTVDEIRLAVAETYDVIVEPDGSQHAYTLFAQAMDRSGYARGIWPCAKACSPVPNPDPRPELTMDDMGHGDHAAHGRLPQRPRRTMTPMPDTAAMARWITAR